MHSHAVGDGAAGCGTDDEGLEKFYAHLSNGLHAMAQPLTILRSSVAASIVPGITPERHARYLGVSVQQVERACSLFESLQDLVIAKQVDAASGPFGLKELAAEAIASQHDLIQAAGVSVVVIGKDDLQQVLGDENRARQAFVAALKVAVAVSAPKATVEVLLHPRDEWIECIVLNQEPHGQNLDSSQQLSLALAETNICSQHGKFECSVDPFRVAVALLAASADR